MPQGICTERKYNDDDEARLVVGVIKRLAALVHPTGKFAMIKELHVVPGLACERRQCAAGDSDSGKI